MSVWTQLEAILTRAKIRAICVNANMFTATIVRLAFIYIWKDKIRQDKINHIVNQPIAHWILLQNTRKLLNILRWKSWYLTPYGDKYVEEGGHCLKRENVQSHVRYRSNIDSPVSTHFNNADNFCFGDKENMILYPAEQIPDQNNAQRNKSLSCERYLHLIKSWNTQYVI